MRSEVISESQSSNVQEVLNRPHTYGVVMPYAQNLKELGDRAGDNRMTFYSAFNLNASYELYKAGNIKKLILCGESTFGEEKSTTSDLMKDALLRLGVSEKDIIVLDKPKLDNTAVQIQAVAQYQKENNLQDQKFLIVDWRFHDERIKNHVKGFGLNAETIQAEDVHKYFEPGFDHARLEELLPKEFEAREKTIRKISQFDKKGLLPRLALIMGRGGSVTDIRKVKDEGGDIRLEFEDTTGKKKLQEYKNKNNPYKRIKILESEGHFDSIFNEIIEKIRSDTNLLASFDELGIANNLLIGFENTAVNGYRVAWGTTLKNVLLDTHPALKPRGHFSPSQEELRVYFSPPKKTEILEWILYGEGYFPGPYSLSGLLHEGTHAFQFPKGISKQEELEVLGERGALFEAQAFRVAMPMLNQNELIGYVISSYGKRYEPDKIEYAVKAVDRLSALGLSILQVAEILWNSGDWDESRRCYSGLESSLVDLGEQKGLTKEALDIRAEQKRLNTIKAIVRAQEITLGKIMGINKS